MKSIISEKRNKYNIYILLILLFSHSCFAQITRTQIHNNADPYTSFAFTASSSNIQYNVTCSPVGNINTPSWVVVGSNVKVPYCWGGFSSLTSFTAGLASGKSAGDNDCSTSGDCCEDCALGVDCSGFVSRAWGLSSKQSTSTLPNISTAYASASDVKQGDIFNLAGSHVRLVDTNYTTGSFLLMESSGADWRVSYRTYTASQLTSYTPRWYVYVDTTTVPCSHNYASIPFSTSFENTWVADGCIGGAERTPDVFWYSSIGGTSPNGNDYWHRDDYTGADWTSTTSGQYTPSASDGSYSARFHNDPPPAGSTGALDLYIDLSTPGDKQINFDYIHDESSPSPFSFDLLLSTDGGVTFPTTLLNITTAQMSSWTPQVCTTSVTSATSVLRFIVTDKGTHDVGIDNLSITPLSTGTTEINNNSGIEIFPNPASDFIKTKTLGKSEIEISDLTGRLIKNIFSGENQTTIDISDLPNGIYFVKVKTDNAVLVKKIIKE